MMRTLYKRTNNKINLFFIHIKRRGARILVKINEEYMLRQVSEIKQILNS